MERWRNYEVLKYTDNESEWIIYFKSLARHYVRSFSMNFEKLLLWSNKLKAGEIQFDAQIIKENLASYYQMYLALSPQKNGDFNIDKKMLSKFYKITDPQKIQKHNEIVDYLGLKKYQILDDDFTLDQLMNIAINFFQDRNLRHGFFEAIISKSDQNLRELKIKDMLCPSNINLQRINLLY